MTHAGVMTLSVEAFGVSPFWGNVLGFAVAVAVSYFGHFYWTFARADRSRPGLQESIPKFIATALSGLALNGLAVYVIVDLWSASYLYALPIIVFVTPLAVFLLCKCWAFAPASRFSAD